MTEARGYRLTRPDDLRFFHRRSAAQFGLCCLGLSQGVLAIVLKQIPVAGRLGLALFGLVLAGVAIARSASGEDVIELVPVVSRFLARRLQHKTTFSAALVPYREADLPPLFAGIELQDLSPASEFSSAPAAFRSVGLIIDKADGSLSVALRLHGTGFLLADHTEQDMRLACFGDALAGLSRDGGSVHRVMWSQFSARTSVEHARADLDEHRRADVDEALYDSYLEMLHEIESELVTTEVLVVLSTPLGGARQQHLHSSAKRLLEEVENFRAALARAEIAVIGPLPAAAIARSLRDRVDPTSSARLDRRAFSLEDRLGLISPHNGFPLCIEEHKDSVVADNSWHRLYRIAEWPKLPVRADWLAPLLCDRDVTRTMSIVFSPQPRRLARRDANAVATKVGAAIESSEMHGRRVGADQRRAQLAAEALDEELEHGAELELIVGLVDVIAPSRSELETACERLCASAAGLGLELRPVPYRQGEALVCALPLGRVVGGRAR
jgi:hypothetical protein